MTTVRSDALGGVAMRRLLLDLGLDSDEPARLEREDARLFVLRHTLMNPFLIDEVNNINYLDRYLAYLARRVRALIGCRPSVALMHARG